MMVPQKLVGLILLTTCLLLTDGQRVKNLFKQGSHCEQSSCYPATGDLLIGRESRLSSTSTCGLTGPERYCIVSHLEDQNNKCFECDSRHPFSSDNQMSHRVDNIISTFKKDWKHRWWQAQNGIENASIRLDLEAEFHFTHLIMKFKTFRPSSMLIERSYDFGHTWKVYRYFAHNCAQSFPGVAIARVKDIQTVICESKYSDVAPSSEGEVIFRVLPANIEIRDPYSQEVQDLLKITNLRVNFTKLHTLGDNLLNSGADVKEKYYFSVYNLVVRGSCSCYGHASRCNPLPGQEDNVNMVHGRCECTHFTKGLNCEQCQDFYNDLPWRPALGKIINSCKKCNCNEHSTKCHFDPAVYVATNYSSGGVCDDCQHNTMGRHCEQCKPFFYHDPERQITDPYACQSCDCDPTGSEHNGECESRTDPMLNTIAGRCICKLNAHGGRCDTCRPGFWNLSLNNYFGCEECNCHPLGTVGGEGCDMYTGECKCKRYVTGRKCDKCLPGYWNLSDHPQGCTACDCDIGGAYNLTCDQYNGMCNCRPNIVGQHCREPAYHYFVPPLDWMRYEGEFAIATGHATVEYRVNPTDRPRTWTGPGFMRVYEGSSLEFLVDNIPYSTHYDVVIRYEPQSHNNWHEVKLTVLRPDEESLDGTCANVIHSDHEAVVDINPSSRHYVVVPSSCLEKGKEYKIKLDFRAFRSDGSSPDESILIDSIVLIPSADHHPVMQYSDPRNVRDEYERYRCVDSYLSPAYRGPLSDICRMVVFSSSSIIHNGARTCDCDPVGSEKLECDPIGGDCMCKHNVIGRRCHHCSPGSFGFGPGGCVDCQCSPLGALDSFCDVMTGQCKCVPNAYGLRCADCQRGYYGFPHCRQCQCSGLSDICDSDTGRCTACRDNSGGDDCSRCAEGYYGDPRSGLGGCRPCMCPGGRDSGMQYADTCILDTRSEQVICNCKPGFAGLSCDRCADNYYGDPLRPGGTCTRCFCNDNIDHSVPNSCDLVTGQCLKCLYETEGSECERCKKGFFGDARIRTCTRCVCNLLGTNQTLLNDCNHVTGQCHCLPNVIGRNCDECDINHWKLASGLGCEHCECDPSGSQFEQCNPFDGQCTCLEGRGGRDCSECPNLYWGNPAVGCKSCSCNPDGSRFQECDKETGQCKCEAGVTGLTCDRCDRGTTGVLPHCLPCGECFDNWEKIIAELNMEAQTLLIAGTDLKLSGSPDAFAKEFEELEKKIEDIKNTVYATNLSPESLAGVTKALNDLRSKLEALKAEMSLNENILEEESNNVMNLNEKYEKLTEAYETLKVDVQSFKDNAFNVQEQDVTGAHSSVQENYNKLGELDGKLSESKTLLDRSQHFRKQGEQMLDNTFVSGRGSDDEDRNILSEVTDSIAEVDIGIYQLNNELCGASGEPCSEDCGGATCGKCGGEKCQHGAVTKSKNAKDIANEAEALIKERQMHVDATVSKLRMANKQCNQATNEARNTHEKAERAKNVSESAGFYVKELLEETDKYLNSKEITKEEVEWVVNKTLSLTISLTPEEINSLSENIQNAAQELTDINAILEETRDDIQNVERIRSEAGDTLKYAESVLDDVKTTMNSLRVASDGHESADKSLREFNMQADEFEENLNKFEKRLTDAKENSHGAPRRLDKVKEKMEVIKSSVERKKRKLQQLENEANVANEGALRIEKSAMEIEEKYRELLDVLRVKGDKVNGLKNRVGGAKQRASQLHTSVENMTQFFTDVNYNLNHQEGLLSRYNHLIKKMIDDMNFYVDDILNSNRFHNSCS